METNGEAATLANAQLRSDVVNLIGNMEEEVISSIVQELVTLGVTHVEDLEWVQEDDLKGKIRPVLVRKLLRTYQKKVKSASEDTSQRSSLPPSPMSQISIGSCSTSSSGSFSPKSPQPVVYDSVNRDPNWPMKVRLPWATISRSIIDNLEKGNRLTPSDKRELIRRVVDSVRLKTHHATSQQFGIIAQRMVAKYTSSLQDTIDGTIIGSGYDVIHQKLISRNQNLNRPEAKLMCLTSKKRSVSMAALDASSDENVTETKRQDSYGCVKWMPECDMEKVSEMEEIRDSLMEMKQNGTCTEERNVETCMKQTYCLQRIDINKGKEMSELKTVWPFLFTVDNLLAHAQELLDIDVKLALAKAYQNKAPRLTSFFKGVSHGKSDYIFEEARRQSCQDNIKAWLSAIILCILDHFNEKESCLFHVMDETSSIDAVQQSAPCDDPLLVVLGDSVLAGKTYMIMCDRTVISERNTGFIDSFAALFASYYIFNLEYQAGAASTLEFLQRCFVGINPDRGSKGNKGKKKKQQMSSKVLRLISQLSDFEWLQS